MKRTLFSLVLLLAVSCATRPDPDAARIDRFVHHAMTKFPEVPSLGVAIVKDGKTILTDGYGFRDVSGKVPADADTVYYIASSTKSYVGLLAAKLAARGVIDLDAPISRYLPETKVNATLRSLLTHTSGISNDAIVMRTAFTGEHGDLVQLLGRSKTIEPKFGYDNLGYVAVGLALERATGKTWQDLLAEEIFTPLGMTRTTAYMSKTASWPVAKPYDVGGPLAFVKNDKTMHAAGGLVTTPRDLARWLEANVNRRGLPEAAFGEALKQHVNVDPATNWYRFKRTGYALGWYHSDYEGTPMLHHFGGYEGWRAHVSFLPEQKHGVAITTNTSSPGAQLRDVIAAYAYDVLLGKAEVDAAYEAHLAKLRTETDASLARIKADVEKRKGRAPSLTRNANAYAGRYANDLYGTIEITPAMRASLGQLAGALEPFTEPDSARVELIPGSGEVLRFKFASGDRAEAVTYREEVFRRVD
ncbi:MAG TPA: serine hydrolase domain-containing protein [Thermoanaerobaculia bacterium]|nr:serine hydrolase domain-containing protein [Thermoanaerobaculia bacterium]